MSPEYAMEGLFSIKSDVYSFGVLVLEIISGRKNTSYRHEKTDSNLIGHVSLEIRTCTNHLLLMLMCLIFSDMIWHKLF